MGQRGPISSRYASESHGRDTTERLFRQFRKVNSTKLDFRSTAFLDVRIAPV